MFAAGMGFFSNLGFSIVSRLAYDIWHLTIDNGRSSTAPTLPLGVPIMAQDPHKRRDCLNSTNTYTRSHVSMAELTLSIPLTCCTCQSLFNARHLLLNRIASGKGTRWLPYPKFGCRELSRPSEFIWLCDCEKYQLSHCIAGYIFFHFVRFRHFRPVPVLSIHRYVSLQRMPSKVIEKSWIRSPS